jgi:hypothetical protein
MGNSCRTGIYFHKNFISYKKVKVAPVHTMMVYRGSGGIAPVILKLSSRSR